MALSCAGPAFGVQMGTPDRSLIHPCIEHQALVGFYDSCHSKTWPREQGSSHLIVQMIDA